MVVTLALAGYVITAQLIAQHPLHGMLASYDREIAAVRSTQCVAALRDPGATAGNAATGMRLDTATVAANVNTIGERNDSANRARERAAATAMLRSESTPAQSFATYASQLAAETNASLRAYGGALDVRTQRAYAARAQQFREKEATLAFDLERRDAGKRLTLRLQLAELHLSPSRRARLQAQLDAYNSSEDRSVDAMRRRDAALLAAYRAQLQRAAAGGAGAMDAELRAKAGANYAILQRVFNESSNAAGVLPSPSQLAAFTNGYAAEATARSVSSGMRSATNDVTQRFERLGAAGAESDRETAAQLRTLQNDRAALYRTIFEEIQSAAERVARERHLGAVRFVNRAPTGGFVNLTQAVALRLAGHDAYR